KTQRERDGSRVQSCVAKALGSLLAKIAERGFELRAVACVFTERLIVRDGLGLGVVKEFEGVDAARFAIEGGAPAAKIGFQASESLRLQLRDGFDAQLIERGFGDFADSRNAADGKRRKEIFFAACGNPNQAARLGLVAPDFCNEAS